MSHVGALPTHPNIQHLHANRKGHSGVDVPFGDVDVEAFHHKHEANHDKEGKRQHLDGRMAFDEARNRLGTHLHHDHRNNNGDHHDEKVLRQANGRDHRVDAEDKVEDDNLRYHDGKGASRLAALLLIFFSFEFAVQFRGGLCDQEESAAEHDNVATGDAMREQDQEWFCKRCHVHSTEEKDDAKDHCERQSNRSCALRLLRRKFPYKDRNEDDVVDAKDDLEDGKRQQGNNAFGGEDVRHAVVVVVETETQVTEPSDHNGKKRSFVPMQFTSVNPATLDTLASYNLMSAADVNNAIAKCSRAQTAWAALPLLERADVIRRLGSVLLAQAPTVANMITAEMGKPLAQARAEVEKCASACTYYADVAEELLAVRHVNTEHTSATIHTEALGIVLCIMPWNFPLWQFIRFAAPALIAGNGIVLKHAPTTWGSAFEAVRLCKEAGIPEDLVACLVIDVADVAPVIAHSNVRAVTFTGSTKGGAAVASMAGANVKKSVLELGGSDAYVVLDDAHVEHAARMCVESRCTNSGQSCIAAKRFIVHRHVINEFTTAAMRFMQAMVVGDPLDVATRIGPLARRDLRDGLLDQVRRAVAGGAVTHSWHDVPDTGFYVAPMILTNVHEDNVACTEELFGPVASIIEAADDADALALANASRYGLGSAVFSADLERASWFAQRLQAGSVAVNDMVRSDARLPFGGVKDSGYGRELGPHGIMEFVNVKSVVVA